MSQKPLRPGNSNSPKEKAKIRSDALRKKILRQIRRARTRMLVCILTLPVYIIAIWLLLNNRQSTDAYMFMYMGVWAFFAVDMARRRCPSCGEQFFVKVVFLNLITHRCVHCGLSMDPETDNKDESVKF